MDMVRLLRLNPNIRNRPVLIRAKIRGLRVRFRCIITNYYFYFRFIAFVNYNILVLTDGHALAQAGGVERWRNVRWTLMRGGQS